MIFNGPIGEFLLAISALVLGAFMIGCGVNVCWLRWRQRGAAKATAGAARRASCPADPGINRVVVFVKEPVPGKVKTRLCPPLTPDQAAALYRGFARDSVALARDIVGSEQVLIAYDGEGGAGGPAWLSADGKHFRQEGDELGARLIRAFDRAFGAGARKVVIIGSDAPHLDRAEIMRALDGLERHDVMLGPAVDGGYYLVALRKAAPALFRGVPWSTSEVLAATLDRAAKSGLSVGMLDLTFDVDTPKDLALLKAALERLPADRLVHTRRLLNDLADTL